MIPFIDLQAQRQRLGQPLEDAILKVVRSGAYIMGPEIAQFEAELAAFGQAPHALSCGSGTEALVLPLMAWGIGPGDAVFCPAFTFAATAEAMPLVGASPVFVDVLPDTYNLDPAKLDAAIAAVKAAGKLTPRAVMAVDLFGQPADYPAIAAVCARHGLKLIADSAQGFGCTLGGQHPIHWADVTTTSFFPAKPLGCYGDGGAVLSKDQRLHELSSACASTARRFPPTWRARPSTRPEVPEHADRHEQPHGHPPGRGPDPEALHLPRRDRRPEPRRRPLRAGPGRRRARPAGDRGRGQRLGAIHDRDRGPRRPGRAPAGGRHPLGGLLPGPASPPGALRPLPGPRRPARHRSAAGKVISLPMHAYLAPDVQDRIITTVRNFVKKNLPA
jgi:dTDP-4-amino-4,6-dideoxygalactose transaminase